MSDDDKPKPIDDLKQGLGLLFRAAKGAVDKIPTEKIEGAVKDGAKEVGKAVESVASEIDKVFVKATSGSQPPAAKADGEATTDKKKDEEEKKTDEAPKHYDDAYAPEPPKGPRIG